MPQQGQRDVATGDRSWEARPHAARAIRVAVVLGPISVGCAAAIGANGLIAAPGSILGAVVRTLGIVAISTSVVWFVDRFARRFIPLAALMQLSLVFPDQAPSRFKSALKSGSSRRLERTLDETRRNGLAKDPGDAARQVVQLIGAIGDHDRRTRGHSERVRLFADLVGEELKLSKEERQKLQWGALLHDLGKLMVPSEILNKKGRPDPEEWEILQRHPSAGMEMIAPLREFLGEWVHAIGGHHEKWDGSGYPVGLRGSEIPRAAAIVAVADSFEVMTAVRSYKKAMPLAEARAELTRCAGQHFSPEVVRAFLNISLGHLRIVAGPVAALAHLPFLGNLAQMPGAAAAAAPSVLGSVAVPAAAAMTAAALTVGAAPRSETVDLVVAERPPAAAAALPAGGPPPELGMVDPAPGATPPTAPPDTVPSPVPAADPAVPSDPAASSPAAAVAPPSMNESVTSVPTSSAVTPSPTSAPPTTTAAPSPRRGPSTTAVPATPPPTTAVAPPAPSTTVAPPPPTAAPATGSFQLQAATNALRLDGSNLHGRTFSRGSRIYVYAVVGADEIHYTYPGGTRTARSFPFDMMGADLLAASSFTVPSAPGTYTITAVAEFDGWGRGSDRQETSTATFTVT